MGILDLFRGGGSGLFKDLSADEKRQALDLNEHYLQSILDSRKGKVEVHEFGTNTGFVKKMTDDDLEQAIAIAQLQQKAMAAADEGRHRDAIRTFERIVAIAPFDAISVMSIGVQYAYLQDGRRALDYLRRALKIEPNNTRIQDNLRSIQQHFGM